MIKMKKVWDSSVVRLNWLFVAGLAGILLTVGASPLLHQVFASLLFIAVALRIFHGFKGASTARFSAMLFPLSDILLHLHDLRSFRPQSWFGHSPLGGLFAFASLLGLGATAISGLLVGTADTLALHVTITSLSLALWSAYALGAVLNLLSNGDSLVNYTLNGRKSVITTTNTEEQAPAPQGTVKVLSLGLGVVLAVFMIVPLVSQVLSQTPATQSSLVATADMDMEAQTLSQIETAAGFRMEMNLDTPVDAKEVIGRSNVRSGASALPSQNEEAPTPTTTQLEDISIEIPALKQ